MVGLVELMIKQFSVCRIDLEPTRGAEQKNNGDSGRPCLVVSPNSMNKGLRTIIIAPLTTQSSPAPFRIECSFKGKKGLVKLDQIRAVDKERVLGSMGEIDKRTAEKVRDCLIEMFS